eukprot:7029574-Lingulodinium_polyedra.AAC.1
MEYEVNAAAARARRKAEEIRKARAFYRGREPGARSADERRGRPDTLMKEAPCRGFGEYGH